ncbi:3-dehydroquinate dehydratase [Cytophaga hutchinsonii ATCC 33406]|uniref:3-dehydroquinate dehydratase n=2 Tax=Cytophaga hutchinsonii TaxID=985 RepID=A0A6N4SU22_CYTH3|nr:3-dehydroquinate dehydratase [Cytophaga hutchinsonii ATCC 33406]
MAYICTMKILILNGPNLNLLGKREPGIYGAASAEDIYNDLKKAYPAISFSYFQSNVEGELVNKLHEVGFDYDGIVFNAGAYTHTSIAIADAVAGIKTPVIEVHISNVYAREEYRHKSLMAKNCMGIITGFGMKSYALAVHHFSTL